MEVCSSKSIRGLFWKNGGNEGNLELGLGVTFYFINQWSPSIFITYSPIQKEMFGALIANVFLIHLKIKILPV